MLRSHLRMKGRWQLPAERGEPGTPWLVLRGESARRCSGTGPVLELDDRAHAAASGRTSSPTRPTSTGCSAGSARADQAPAIGEALLDQRLVAGIGNVWRAEALWRAQISPWRALARRLGRGAARACWPRPPG